MVRRCPPQRKNTTPIRCSSRIKKLNMRPKLDVVFQNFPIVKQSFTSTTNTPELHVQSSKSFGNGDVLLRSENQNSTFTLMTNTVEMKKTKPEEEVNHPLTITGDFSEEAPISLSKTCPDLSRTEENQKQLQEKSAILPFEIRRNDLESPVLFDDNANSLIGQSVLPPENRFIPLVNAKKKSGRPSAKLSTVLPSVNDENHRHDLDSPILFDDNANSLIGQSVLPPENRFVPSVNAKKKSGRPSAKLSTVFPSVNDENYRHDLDSPVLFDDNANSFVGQSALAAENCLIPSVNAYKKRRKPSKKQTAIFSSDAEDSIPLSKLFDCPGSSLSKNSSKLLLSSVKANKKKRVLQKKQSTVSSIAVNQKNDLNSFASFGNNAPVGSFCSEFVPLLKKKMAKKETRPRKKPGILLLANDGNLNAPEYLGNSNSMRKPFSKICTNLKPPLMNVKARKEKQLPNIFRKDGLESFLSGVKLLSIRGQTKTKREVEKKKSLIAETQNFESSFREMESQAENVRFRGNDEGKRTNDAFSERQSRRETEPVDDLCSLFSDIKLQTKCSLVKKADDSNLDTKPTTSRYEPKSGTNCEFCHSVKFHFPERSLASGTTRHSSDINFFETNATNNLYDVNSSPDLNLDIDRVLKCITKIQVRVPCYEPYTEGECWWEGFDEWSSS